MRLQEALPFLTSLLLPEVLSQIVSDLPQCWQNCIKNSGDFTCDPLDLSCKHPSFDPSYYLAVDSIATDIFSLISGICSLSSSDSNFLTTAISCIKSTCDSLDTSLLLTPLQLACNLAGSPISDSAITSAENAGTVTTSTASSYDNGHYNPPYTVTPGTINGYYTPDPSPASASETEFYAQTTFPLPFATTVSTTFTDSNGNTIAVRVPVTIDISTTIYGTPETQPISTPSSTSTSASTSTTTATTSSVNGAAFTSSIQSDISVARSSALAASTSAFAASPSAPSTSSGSNSNGDSGNGSPFDQQGAAAANGETNKKSLLGAAMMVAVGVIWF